MTPRQLTQCRAMLSSGYRRRHVAAKLGVSLGELTAALSCREIAEANEREQAASAVRELLREGYSDDAIRASFGGLVSPARMETIKHNLAKGA